MLCVTITVTQNISMYVQGVVAYMPLILALGTEAGRSQKKKTLKIKYVREAKEALSECERNGRSPERLCIVDKDQSLIGTGTGKAAFQVRPRGMED